MQSCPVFQATILGRTWTKLENRKSMLTVGVLVHPAHSTPPLSAHPVSPVMPSVSLESDGSAYLNVPFDVA